MWSGYLPPCEHTHTIINLEIHNQIDSLSKHQIRDQIHQHQQTNWSCETNSEQRLFTASYKSKDYTICVFWLVCVTRFRETSKEPKAYGTWVKHILLPLFFLPLVFLRNSLWKNRLTNLVTNTNNSRNKQKGSCSRPPKHAVSDEASKDNVPPGTLKQKHTGVFDTARNNVQLHSKAPQWQHKTKHDKVTRGRQKS